MATPTPIFSWDMPDGQIKGRTHLRDLMDLDFLEKMRLEGYVRVKPHPTQPLHIWNYAEKAMFEKEWNAVTLKCRGLIVDEQGYIVARPWDKFFNLGEKATLIGSHDPVEITDKADGSLGIGYPIPRGFEGPQLWAIATRGSFQSDQALWATKWMAAHPLMWSPTPAFTPLFEIVYPQNRIVLDYGDFEGLILLGCIDTQHGHVYGPKEAAGILCWGGEVTEVFPEKTMAEFMSGPNASRANAEGVVVRSGWRMVKLKQDDYVKAHAIVTGLSNKSVWEALAVGQGVPEQASFMPDEFYAWLVDTAAKLTEAQNEWVRTATREFQSIGDILLNTSGGSATRKDFAVLAGRSPYSAALFKLYDAQSIDALAWRAVRPETFERPFSRSEDNS